MAQQLPPEWPVKTLPATTVRVIDTETAGGRMPDDAVIEIGSVDYDLVTGEVGNRMEVLVDPEGTPISPGARKVHKIEDEELEGAAPFAEAVLPYADATTFAAHRATFDSSRLRIPGTWLCTWKLALRAFPEQRAHGLQSLVRRLELKPELPEGSHAHRALYDAVCTVELLRACHRVLGERCDGPLDFLARAAKVSAEPGLLARLRFGKHKHEPIREVPTDYLVWLAAEPDMDSDAAFTARHELRRRGVGEGRELPLRDPPAGEPAPEPAHFGEVSSTTS